MKEYPIDLNKEPNWNFSQEFSEPVFLFKYNSLQVYSNSPMAEEQDPAIFYLTAVNSHRYLIMGVWLIKVLRSCVAKTNIVTAVGYELETEKLRIDADAISRRFALMKLKESK